MSEAQKSRRSMPSVLLKMEFEVEVYNPIALAVQPYPTKYKGVQRLVLDHLLENGDIAWDADRKLMGWFKNSKYTMGPTAARRIAGALSVRTDTKVIGKAEELVGVKREQCSRAGSVERHDAPYEPARINEKGELEGGKFLLDEMLQKCGVEVWPKSYFGRTLTGEAYRTYQPFHYEIPPPRTIHLEVTSAALGVTYPMLTNLLSTVGRIFGLGDHYGDKFHGLFEVKKAELVDSKRIM